MRGGRALKVAYIRPCAVAGKVDTTLLGVLLVEMTLDDSRLITVL